MESPHRRRPRAKPAEPARHESAKDAHEPGSAKVKLKLAGTPMFGDVSDDEALATLREACRLLELLREDRARIEERLAATRRLDPVRVVTGRSALDRACAETEELIRQVDDYLSETAERVLSAPRK